MLDFDENIYKASVIQILHYFIQKECDGWFITDFKVLAPGSTTDTLVNLYTSELMFDQERGINYHWQRTQSTNPYKVDEFIIWLRDYKISEINDESLDTFSHEDRLKIELLRIQSHFDSNKKKVITREEAIKERNKNLKEGDRVYFNTMPGIISYKHKGDELKFTINVKNTYYKYVPASKLIPRIKKDLSHIEVPKKYQEMSTTQLLNLRRYGSLPDVIKAELNKREHIKRKPKTKIYGSK
jgi:hypothetical protein